MVDSKGHLLVLQRDIGVTGHEVDETGCVISTKTIIADSQFNHGMDVVGDKLFVSAPDVAWVWDYDPETMTATNRKTLVTGMLNSFHITRSIHVSRKYPDFISLSVGSEGNLDLPSFDPAIGRSQIRTFDMRELPEGGVTYNSSYGKVLGYGLRNCVGVTEDKSGTVFAVGAFELSPLFMLDLIQFPENSLDDAHRVINSIEVDIHEDNPAEKIYRLGTASSPNESFFGGYPYCYSVWNETDIPNADLSVGQFFVQDPNGAYSDAWCNINSATPKALLPPHAAPLDIKFGVRPDDTNLYVALHGSSAREVPLVRIGMLESQARTLTNLLEIQGYKVVAIPGTYSETGEWSPSLDLAATKRGTVDIFFNHNETECRAGCFRPCGMAFAPNGDLYVSSDTSGEVFLLKPPPFGVPPTITGASIRPTHA
ncbi:hypothetical protein NMY22_g17790 [Coprinellus aureogranulatus]|nr:hypothetical protein NMY22_g17790 [Coprinellus aureogranulatus]